MIEMIEMIENNIKLHYCDMLEALMFKVFIG